MNNNFKVTVDVNVNLSEDTCAFLKSLFFTGCSRPTSIQPTTAEEPEAKPEVKSESISATKPAVSKPNVPIAELKQKVHEALTAAPEITREMVRKELALKINEHRAAIKEKLEAFGAPNVTQLEEKYLLEMYNYIKSL